MIKSKALGIIFPNMHDGLIVELTAHRTMASVPFGGRYRIIDFPLSAMSTAGIENVGVVVKQNYLSLMDHLSNGREWDLSSKNGGLKIFPPYNVGGDTVYHGRIEAFHSIITFIEKATEDTVIFCDCNFVANVDYSKLLKAHKESGADATVVYVKEKVSGELENCNYCYKFDKSGRVNEVLMNDYGTGKKNVGLPIFMMKRELLIELIKESYSKNQYLFERDVLAKNCDKIVIKGYEFTGYFARILDRNSFFKANMDLLKTEIVKELFEPSRPIYTKVRDEAPVRYAVGSTVKNSAIADGCLIEGSVENSVIFRGVKVGKGAIVKNTVLMQGTVVEADAKLNYVITDKDVVVSAGAELNGTTSYQVYVKKGERV